MTAQRTLKTPLLPLASDLEPMPDPPKIPDMKQHAQLMEFDAMLLAHFAGRDDVLVCGEGFLRYERGNNDERLAPDCVVTFGVNARNIIAANGYVINEVGKPPDLVLEVASRATGRRDYTVKRRGYAAYGVGEYWRFDHTGGRFHDAPLAGDLLEDGAYAPIPLSRNEAGLIWGRSPLLGLDLCWDDGELRIYDPVGERYLPTPAELKGELNAAQARAAALDAENRRLREELRRLQAEKAGYG